MPRVLAESKETGDLGAKEFLSEAALVTLSDNSMANNPGESETVIPDRSETQVGQTSWHRLDMFNPTPVLRNCFSFEVQSIVHFFDYNCRLLSRELEASQFFFVVFKSSI